jgi:phosphoenolpyruvate-protein phosphotransferase (PTS system enzyme I)
MPRARSPLVLQGTVAAAGFARGPLVHLDAPHAAAPTRASRASTDDSARLRHALDAACAQLAQLMTRNTDPDAKALLAFQIAMLRDPVVTAPAFEALASGDAAEQAWQRAMDLQLQLYDSADDSYFRTRGADLRDLRDRVLRALSGTASVTVPLGAVVVATDLPPSRFLEITWDGGGIALTQGGLNSHVAMLARARGVPMLIELDPHDLDGHTEVLLDAVQGCLVASPDTTAVDDFNARQRQWRNGRLDAQARIALPAETADGERVQLSINVADGSELAGLDPAWCDGIGLVRTELLLRTHHDLLDEERQYAAYADLIRWAQGRTVTVRLLDAGGDKRIAGYTVDDESHPFLGLRGVRLSLRHLDVLHAQLRAIARAAALGPLQVLVPMVTNPREFTQIRRELRAAIQALGRAGVAHASPALGMMIEVPAAALTCDLFDADFLSIGSNDLLQYLTACSRDSTRLATLQDPLQPAMLRLLRSVVLSAEASGIPVGLCGDMAGDPRCLPALLDLGLRRLSVAPALLGDVKNTLSRYRRTNAAQERRT